MDHRILKRITIKILVALTLGVCALQAQLKEGLWSPYHSPSTISVKDGDSVVISALVAARLLDDLGPTPDDTSWWGAEAELSFAGHLYKVYTSGDAATHLPCFIGWPMPTFGRIQTACPLRTGVIVDEFGKVTPIVITWANLPEGLSTTANYKDGYLIYSALPEPRPGSKQMSPTNLLGGVGSVPAYYSPLYWIAYPSITTASDIILKNQVDSTKSASMVVVDAKTNLQVNGSLRMLSGGTDITGVSLAAFSKAVWTKDGNIVAPQTVEGSAIASSYVPRQFFPINSFDSSRDAGTYTCTFTSDTNPTQGQSLTLTFQLVSAASSAPTIVSQPADVETKLGASFSLVTDGAGGQLTYQWKKDGQVLVGATNRMYSVPSATANDVGRYECVVTNSLGSIVTRAAVVSLPSDPSTPPSEVAVSRLFNISTLSYVGTGDNVQIAGFSIVGTEPKRVLVRAGGPALIPFNVTGVLADPQLVVRKQSDQSIVGSNDDWGKSDRDVATTEAIFKTCGAYDFARGSKDAAIVLDLAPGNYTAVVSGGNDGSGTSLVEVYEVTAPVDSRTVNISTRAMVTKGSETMIVGFSITGSAKKKLLIRASGPALKPWIPSGFMSDPTIELRKPSDGSLVASNADWCSDPWQVQSIKDATKLTGAFDWTEGSKDAALLITLPAGNYTAVVRDADGKTGVGLVEVYEIP